MGWLKKNLDKIEQISKEEIDEPRKHEQDQLAKRRAEKQGGDRR